MIRSFMREDHRAVITHGDLNPRNIMASWETKPTVNELVLEKELRSAVLIDWEMAGWYPEYWEFVKALNTLDARGLPRDWVDFMPTEAIDHYPLEYSAGYLVGRWLG
ncbi:hypothetical protein CFIMG_004424RAa [Ceratocystis fimbriata CBS 114723]|uniref:Aminoglycoside phosphotransferase domain-containing protein n=1 Tax=Ceratocystis fimbriata CBS 114723 TaxID=1035309 RepID=A0A2C5WXP4_9PEZI|nr:hypothetical protein CFIMG_004424RAa [Ceratocystis fimbriata CBS 114723]